LLKILNIIKKYSILFLILLKNHAICLNNNHIGSFGVSKIDLGFNLMGIFVFLHGNISNFDIISANAVLASITANRIPVFMPNKQGILII